MTHKRKPISEGQPSQWHPGNYQFVRFLGCGVAVFREGENGKDEVFAARREGVAGWSIKWRGTYWEFCRSA